MRPSPTAPPEPSAADDRVPRASRRIVARAPTRIDFGGGWTDVPPYPERDGGYVCNVAISRWAVVTLASSGDHDDAHPMDALAAAALRRAGVAHTYDARLTNDFPIGAGLGGSSAAGVAVQAALAALSGAVADPGILAARSRAVEVEELGIAGGWQDHHAAAHGGALGIGYGTTADVERLPLPSATVDALEHRCLLVYTGETRISGSNIRAVLEAYAARDARVLAALARMAVLARGMAASLRSGDIDALGAAVAEHWVHQRSLHPAITTPRIDEIARRAHAAGAIGTKALGASGGGCVIVVTDADPAPVRASIAPLGDLLPWRIAGTGASIEEFT